jgi:signal transduction histidine kinase
MVRLFAVLDLLDARLSRLGVGGSTAMLALLAASCVVPLHVLIRTLEGLPTNAISMINIAFEVAIVTAPILYYARRMIAKLKHSQTRLNEMTRRLAVSVEEAQHANRAKSAFLANMSHELRTPLNAIMGFSEVMKDQHLGPLNNARYLGYASDIHASGGYLLGIINDILDLSKIEAGKMSLESSEEFLLQDSIEGALHMVAPLADKFGVRLACDMRADGVHLLAVERMVRQIVINLVGNAIKFTPAGGSVRITGEAAPGGGYRVRVRDTGIGMTEEETLRALQPFGQIESRMNARHSGTGLGLPLAKAMLELHGGALSIESTPSIGTSVILHFPAARISTGHVIAAA